MSVETEGSSISESGVGVIVAAAGLSSRLGTDKLWASLAGQPLLGRSLKALSALPGLGQMAVVVKEHDFSRLSTLLSQLGIVAACVSGGQTRQESVWRGLQALKPCDWVVIHDGARPLVTLDLAAEGLRKAREFGAAIAAVPVKSTVKRVQDGIIVGSPRRQDLWEAQTPQVFSYSIAMECCGQIDGTTATDDAELVTRAGHTVAVFMGSYDNIKVTTWEDLELAELILRRRGQG